MMNHFSNSVCCLTCCVLVLRDCSSSDAYCFSASFTSASVKLRSDTFCTHTWMYFLWGRVKAGSRISQDKKKKTCDTDISTRMEAHLLPAESSECLVLKGM